MLRASNNYVANQVFLEIGGHRLGGPVSLEKSLKVANEILTAQERVAALAIEDHGDDHTFKMICTIRPRTIKVRCRPRLGGCGHLGDAASALDCNRWRRCREAITAARP